jgi:DNA-binding beta-propeller fold protein YncE
MNKILLVTSLLSASLVVTGCFDSKNKINTVVNNPDLGGGKILLYTTAGEFIDAANVGSLPDMVKFTADGKQLISANEGEPLAANNDPKGSISIITLAADKKVQDVTTLMFDGVAVGSDVRIQPGKTAAEDLEPEYIAISEDGKRAWVTLQENNAIAYVDIDNKAITAVKGLGEIEWKNRSVDIVADGIANPATAPDNVFALYMPDTIQSYNVGGKDYFVMANEGDDREYGWYEDYEKASNLTLASSFNGTPVAGGDAKKLRVLKDLGKDDADVYQKLYMAGTRSFSIRDAQGAKVFDSGSDIEIELATNFTTNFNTRVDDTNDVADIQELINNGTPHEIIDGTAYFWEGVDARSLKKGGEPEALSLAKIGTRVYAYVGLEKQGGFLVYDITDPVNANKIQYFNDVDYSKLPSKSGDLAPEGSVTFEQDGKHYLAVANELSSTLSVYALANNGIMSKVSSIKVGAFNQGAAEILDYDASSKSLFVTNGENKTVDIYDVSSPATLIKTRTINFSQYADALQSVSVKDGVLAIAVDKVK